MENLMHANMFSALDLEALQQFCEADSRKLALHMILETLSEAYLQTAIISVRTLLLSHLSALELLVTAKEDPAIAKTDSKALKVACAATEGFQDFTKRCSTSLSTWNLHLHDIILVGDNVFDQEFAMIGYRRGNCSDLLSVAETMQDINPCCVAQQEYLTCMSVVARDDELLMSPDTDGRLKHNDIAKWLIEAKKDDDDDEDEDDDDDDDDEEDDEDDEDEEDVDAGEGEEDVGIEEGDGDDDEDDEDGNEEDDDEKADDGDDGDEEEGEDEDGGGDEGEGEEDAEDDDEEDEDEEEEDDDEEEEPPKKKRK